MDINNIGSNQIRERAIREPGSESAKSSQPDSQASGTRVEVDLSGDASRLTRLEAEVRDLPEVDKSRVEAIRAQIAEGRYHVDPERLAEKFISLERELAGTQS
ncbi:MAG: flagellar biosynthesis anti-sigma factor FlgM [Pseudomonadaceae bacterium]|nr:flagellar biosynthesis anti-sigma factor FlgM [Pseudomonadaceae bacterium]